MSNTELLLGDPAPEIRVERFLKGDPITGFARGTAFVVEFWATWCGPCKASIPHLTALQARYPQVPFLGVAVTWKDMGELETFVREQGDAMDYRVAADAPPEPGARRGWMHGAWCEASYQLGIPAAFIVDGDGRIAWIGHPMDIDAPLAAVVEGTWDLPGHAQAHRDQLVRDKVRQRRALEREVADRLQAGDRPGAIRVYAGAFATDPDLERSHGFGRLKLLQAGDVAAVPDYATHLIRHAVHNDVNTLFKIATGLVELAGDTSEGAVDEALGRAVATLAVEAIERATALLDAPPQGTLRLRLSRTLAEALLAGGRATDAAPHAEAARAAAVETDAPDATLLELDALIARCAESAIPERPAARTVICEGDSCSLADA